MEAASEDNSNDWKKITTPLPANVRYDIADNFLRFWFKYINRNLNFIESENFQGLASLIKDDYPTYSDLTLERYFRQKLMEQHIYRNIGSWWETSKGKDTEQNEIDIHLHFITFGTLH